MKALIFAAGKGTRMQPLTFERPKPLLEVLGKPILEYTFEALPPEVTEVVLVIGYKGQMVKDLFGDNFAGRKITYVTQEEQLGTGDALWICRSLIAPDERFLIIYSDDIYNRESFSRLLKHDRAILTARVDHPERFGIVVADPSGMVVDIEEKPEHPKSNIAWIGTMLIDADVFEQRPSEDPRHKEHTIQSMVIPYMRTHKTFAEEADLWIPIGYPEDLKKAELALSGHG
jgi:UDP-N-acetylglucosamine diphosphorylase / glucose-1-phosphate thymidylyltransferase / UDP-N-acetylgalactosamine diphosphorylase / glucosamine-1-phosphate N-acetyltransferase / galactosamine-1-phosphate N-acetyltransferase